MKTQENTPMRDAFFNRLFELAKEDRNIIVIAADMGAPAMDQFRTDLAGQYIDAGIAEQSAILTAAGLAHSGKKPYVYAIAPFVSTRIHEFIKIEAGLMKLPIKLLGVGAGYGYNDSGPTHHNVEDISIITPIPNVEVYNPSDSFMTAHFAEITAKSNKPAYIRLDRKNQRGKYANTKVTDFSEGYTHMGETQQNGLCIIATGNTVDIALDAKEHLLNKTGQKADVIDFYRLKPITDKLKNTIKKYDAIITIEEHMLRGGMGSIISEIITDNNIPTKLKRIGLTNYTYEYGTREDLQAKMGITKEAIINSIESLL